MKEEVFLSQWNEFGYPNIKVAHHDTRKIFDGEKFVLRLIMNFRGRAILE